ncbi:MAG: replication initiator protein A, partial [Bryobacteraceae bacterium]|nr:replication initiator protein A [Bryobacteraceae bacterium]
MKHVRQNGRFRLEVIGHPDYGLPFGQDRLVPLWVATLAVRQQSRTVSFDSAAQVLDYFGLPKDGVHYRRLIKSFKRIFASSVYFGSSDAQHRNRAWEFSRFHFFDRMKVWYAPSGHTLPEGAARNLIVLSELFWREISCHPIPFDASVIRALAHSPGSVDFYTWLSRRSYNTRTEDRIPLFGPRGLVAQLGVGEYTRDRNFRKRLREWLNDVRLCWAECPARISDDGSALIVAP